MYIEDNIEIVEDLVMTYKRIAEKRTAACSAPIQDMLTDLFHLGHAEGKNIGELIQNALYNFQFERRQEGMPPADLTALE